jgi:hypothetical protein
MKKFFITESEIKHIKSLYITEDILNEGIPGLSSAVKVGMKQGLGDASKAELKKMIQKSFPKENVDDVYKRFESEFVSSKNPDKVIEKYFKGAQDDMLEDFCQILAKESPSKFSRYSLDVISTPETSRIIRYAVEHPEKYTLEQLEKIDGGYRDILETLDDTDPFTLEVKNNLETQYGDKLKQNIESKKGASSSTSSSSKLDELGITTQIQNYLNPNRFDGLNRQAFDAQFVLTKNNLSRTSDIFSNQTLLNDLFGTIFSKNATAEQIQELLNAMSMKIAFNKEQQEVFGKLLNYFSTGKNPSFGKYQTPWLNDLANMSSSAWNGAKPIVEPIADKLVKKGVKALKVAGITVGIVVFLVIVLLFSAISALRGGGSKKERKYNSKYED